MFADLVATGVSIPVTQQGVGPNPDPSLIVLSLILLLGLVSASFLLARYFVSALPLGGPSKPWSVATAISCWIAVATSTSRLQVLAAHVWSVEWWSGDGVRFYFVTAVVLQSATCVVCALARYQNKAASRKYWLGAAFFAFGLLVTTSVEQVSVQLYNVGGVDADALSTRVRSIIR